MINLKIFDKTQKEKERFLEECVKCFNKIANVEIKMTDVKLPDERLKEWLERDPTQIWYCQRCMGLHAPDWNCTKSFMWQVGKTDIDSEVKQVMKQKGIIE